MLPNEQRGRRGKLCTVGVIDTEPCCRKHFRNAIHWAKMSKRTILCHGLLCQTFKKRFKYIDFAFLRNKIAVCLFSSKNSTLPYSGFFSHVFCEVMGAALRVRLRELIYCLWRESFDISRLSGWNSITQKMTGDSIPVRDFHMVLIWFVTRSRMQQFQLITHYYWFTLNQFLILAWLYVRKY